MTKPAKFYALMSGGEQPWILDLAPRTRAECERAIAWQRTGGNDEPMYIVRWDAVAKAFVDDNGAARAAHQGAYTDAAWARFLSGLQS